MSAGLHGLFLWGASVVLVRAAAEREEPEPVLRIDLRPALARREAPLALPPAGEVARARRDEIPAEPVRELVAIERVAMPEDEAVAFDAGAGASGARIAGAGLGGAPRSGHARVGRPRAASDRAGPSSAGPGGGAGGARTDGDPAGAIAPPRVVSAAQPAYPTNARRRGEEGDVRCAAWLDAAGHVERVEIVEILISSGSAELDDAARAAMASWTYRPATIAGTPCACRVEHVISFRLRDGRPSEIRARDRSAD